MNSFGAFSRSIAVGEDVKTRQRTCQRLMMVFFPMAGCQCRFFLAEMRYSSRVAGVRFHQHTHTSSLRKASHVADYVHRTALPLLQSSHRTPPSTGGMTEETEWAREAIREAVRATSAAPPSCLPPFLGSPTAGRKVPRATPCRALS